MRKEDPEAKLLKNYDISSMHTLFLAGERADPDTVAGAEKALGVPVVDHWWATLGAVLTLIQSSAAAAALSMNSSPSRT